MATLNKAEAALSKPFKPSATELTVHSKRNRQALENQLRDAAKQDGKAGKKQKEPLQFEHKLLLGHVSMLTAMTSAVVGAKQGFEKPRSYILTADRDEHIRVSRGIPQAHIVEGFCLGHTQFVSSLCLPKPNLLVSGGGDDFLLVWHWLDCELVKKIDLRETVERINKETSESAEDLSVAVTGIWTVSTPPHSHIFVAIEGLAALLCLDVGLLERPETTSPESIPLKGNALDVTVQENGVVISIDNNHRPNSKTGLREDIVSRLQAFQYDGKSWVPDDERQNVLDALDDDTHSVEATAHRDLLYHTESLRKRASDEQGD
ncbi:hypothetical protein LTS18_006913 [Coniosporium uncinatum]|uniref:Uncharacterized protein n=1 Tax=Coniosporium uncinatum TaxID=93489 RepID=A0ACC3DQ68_9PEZI|nr:hypothetical protein LTS18_006913 [Coniosporium uncinatum]